MLLMVDTWTNDLGVDNSRAKPPEQWYQNLEMTRAFAVLALEHVEAAME